MKEFECFLENKVESIKFSKGIIESYISSHIDDFCQEFLTETKTIVAECVSNCVLHSHASEIIMSISKDDEYIYIDVEDNGCGIEDIEKAKCPLYTTAKDQERAGMGFTIVDVFSDEFIIISQPLNGTTIKLTKKIS